MQKCEKRKITENISSSKEKEKKNSGAKKKQFSRILKPNIRNVEAEE